MRSANMNAYHEYEVVVCIHYSDGIRIMMCDIYLT